jgi:hypothetical protein
MLLALGDPHPLELSSEEESALETVFGEEREENATFQAALATLGMQGGKVRAAVLPF